MQQRMEAREVARWRQAGAAASAGPARSLTLTLPGEGVACCSRDERAQKVLKNWLIGSSRLEFAAPAVWDNLSGKFYAALRTSPGSTRLVTWSLTDTVHLCDLPEHATISSDVHSLHPLGASDSRSQDTNTAGAQFQASGGVLVVVPNASVAVYDSSLTRIASIAVPENGNRQAVEAVALSRLPIGMGIGHTSEGQWKLAVLVAARAGNGSVKETEMGLGDSSEMVRRVEFFCGGGARMEEGAAGREGNTYPMQRLGSTVLGGQDRGKILTASYNEEGHLTVMWADGTWSVHKSADWAQPDDVGKASIEAYSRKLTAFSLNSGSTVTSSSKKSKKRTTPASEDGRSDALVNAVVALVAVPGTAYVAAVGRCRNRTEKIGHEVAKTADEVELPSEGLAVAILDSKYGCVHLLQDLLGQTEERVESGVGRREGVSACWVGGEDGILVVGSTVVGVLQIEVNLPPLSLAGLLGSMALFGGRAAESWPGFSTQAAQAGTVLLGEEEGNRLRRPPRVSMLRLDLNEVRRNAGQKEEEDCAQPMVTAENGSGDAPMEEVSEERRGEGASSGVQSKNEAADGSKGKGFKKKAVKLVRDQAGQGKGKVVKGRKNEESGTRKEGVELRRKDELWEGVDIKTWEHLEKDLIASIEGLRDITSLDSLLVAVRSYVEKCRKVKQELRLGANARLREGGGSVKDVRNNHNNDCEDGGKVNGLANGRIEEEGDSDEMVDDDPSGQEGLQGKGGPEKSSRQGEKWEQIKRSRDFRAAAEFMSPSSAAVIASWCLHMKCWELLRMLVDNGQLTAMECPELVTELVKNHQLGILEALLLHYPDLPPSDLTQILHFILNLDNKGADVDISKLVKRRKRIAMSAVEALRNEINNRKVEKAVEQAAEAEVGTVLRESDVATCEGGPGWSMTTTRAIIGSAAVDGFTPSELSLHALIAVRQDEVILATAIAELDSSEVAGLAKYLRKWMEKFTSRLCAVPLSALHGKNHKFPVPRLKQVIAWTAVLLDCHLARLVLLPEVFQDLMKLQECVASQMAMACSLAPLTGMLDHIQRGAPLPEKQSGPNSSEKMYSVELVDWS